jgi:hypothetical protein
MVLEHPFFCRVARAQHVILSAKRLMADFGESKVDEFLGSFL